MSLSGRSALYVNPLPQWAELLLFVSVLGLLFTGYWNLLNPYWCIGSDSDFFLAVARNVAQGEGLTHNGNPVGTTPPGWPMILAAGMKLSHKLTALKLINIAALLSFFGAGWWVMRRFFPPTATAAATLLIGFSPAVTVMTWSFLSDPTFAALAALAIYAAIRTSEGARLKASSFAPARESSGKARRIVSSWLWPLACVVFATLAVTVRWPGILLVPLLAAALLDGEAWWRPRLDLRWATILVTAALVFATFFGLRWYLKPGPDVYIDTRFPDTMVGGEKGYKLLNTDRVTSPLDYVNRLRNSGRYMSDALWLPLARTKWAIPTLSRAGMTLLLCGAFAAILAMRRRRWLLAGAFAYSLPIMVSWPTAVPRYLLPVLPILVAGGLIGLIVVMRWLVERGLVVTARLSGSQSGTEGEHERAVPWLARGYAAGLVSLLVLATLAWQALAYSGDYLIMRSGSRFGESMEAGTHRRLPAIAQVLAEWDVQPGDVAISERKDIRKWTNLTHGWMRALCALLDRPVRVVPYKISRPLETSPETLQWLRDEGVRFYAWLPPADSTFQFRTGRIETYIVENRPPLPVPPEQLRETDWWLYEIDDSFEGGFVRIDLPAVRPPKRVPHLE